MTDKVLDRIQNACIVLYSAELLLADRLAIMNKVYNNKCACQYAVETSNINTKNITIYEFDSQ